MEYALTLENVSCERDDRVLFSQLNAEFTGGDLVQIKGPNGAGKTTLLKILTGLSSRYEGGIRWCAQDVPHFEFYHHLLYLGHAPGVNSSLTPKENLHWFFGLHGAKGDDTDAVTDKDIAEALSNVGLAGYEDFPCYQMSAGQQRRVALARLFVSHAKLWILDEPFTAIDTAGVAAIEQRIQSHVENGGIVVLTTHQPLLNLSPTIIDLADYQEGSNE